MRKIFWFDVETTGLSATKNSMIQLAGLIEINGEIKKKIEILFRPQEGREINDIALKINKKTVNEINQYPPINVGISKLKVALNKHVNKYDQTDKFVPAGYNVNFDLNFLRNAWFSTGDQYGPGSYLFNAPLDVRTDVARMILSTNIRLKNYKLTSLCEYFGIDTTNAHDAMFDIIATRKVSNKILKIINKNRRKL